MKISYQNVLFTIILFSVYTCIVLKIWGGNESWTFTINYETDASIETYLITLNEGANIEDYFNNSMIESVPPDMFMVPVDYEKNLASCSFMISLDAAGENDDFVIRSIGMRFSDGKQKEFSWSEIQGLADIALTENCKKNINSLNHTVLLTVEDNNAPFVIRFTGLETIIEEKLSEYEDNIIRQTLTFLLTGYILLGLFSWLSFQYHFVQKFLQTNIQNKVTIIVVGVAIACGLLIGLIFAPASLLHQLLTAAAVLIAIFINIRIIIKAFDWNKFLTKNNIAILGIVLAGISVFLPFMFSNYFFGDEWWTVDQNTREVSSDSGSLLIFGRAFQIVLAEAISNIPIRYIGLIRFIGSFQAIFFAVFLYSFIKKRCGNIFFSTILAVIIVYNSITIDCVAYFSIITFMTSVNCMAWAYDIYLQRINCSCSSKKHIIIWTVFFGSAVALACHFYQLGITIIFFLTAIDVMFSESLLVKWKNLLYLCSGFAGGVAFYYLTLGLLSQTSNSRGEMISLAAINDKVRWFCAEIIPTALSRICAAFGGNFLFTDTTYWARIHWISQEIRLLIGVIAGFLLVFLVVNLLRRGKLLRLFLLMICIPLSYGINLLLSENTYHTYYAYALICTLLFYLLVSVFMLLGKRQKAIRAIMVCIAAVMIFRASQYLQVNWIKQNEQVLDYISVSLKYQMEKKDTKKIHFYGAEFYGEHPVYAQAAIRVAFRYLERDVENYEITISESRQSAIVILKEEYERIYANASSDSQKKLDNMFEYKEITEYYILKEKYREDPFTLHLLKENGFLPMHENDYLILDLGWYA